ncbi:MAG: phosphate transport system regulatory protein PhoU [Clostridiales bacterium]|nr:MAG: phosphate transport system regulatory protein PhoU [Clostridiales bacterium]
MGREQYDEAIGNLKSDVVSMMENVEEIFVMAVDSLVSQDIEKARRVIMLDDEIDRQMERIEEASVELIALQQPMAIDLRTIFSIAKIITDLERVGDFSVNIAKETIKIGDEPLIKPLVDIPKMQRIISGMLRNAKRSFVDGNISIAYEVGEEDEIIDNLYKDIYSEILILIHEDGRYINQGTKLLFIGRYLERIADHITNICERIIYIYSGESANIN